jgi:hypothetical protein
MLDFDLSAHQPRKEMVAGFGEEGVLIAQRSSSSFLSLTDKVS